MVPYRIIGRHGSTVLQKSCSTVGACFRTFQGIGRGSSADGHGIGQVAGIDHAAAACVFHAVLRSVGEPVVGGHLGISACYRLGKVQVVVGEREPRLAIGIRPLDDVS